MLEKVVKNFLAFLPYVKIRSKDKGIIKFDKPYWGQKLILREMMRANSEQRTFAILKARQLGITTLLSVLDLFYVMFLSGVKGAILFASYKDAYRIRYDLTTLYDLLPTSRKTLLTSSNREAMRFSNTSELYFLYTSNRAGSKGMAGRGNSFNYLHASEVAYFKSWEDFDAIQSALSDSFKYRLYVYESTANGYNEFYDLWETAKKSPVMKAIFIGWWSKDDNYLPHKKEYEEFFRPPDSYEKAWIKKVKAYYDYDLTIEQLAWWRYQLQVKYRNNEIMCLQELPFTEDEAFQLSGSKFFPALLLQDMFIRAREKEYDTYKLYMNGNNLYVVENEGEPNLWVWEYPQEDGMYVIGADPTMGANPDSDNAVISIFRVYSDKTVQVAEFVDNRVPPQVFARILLVLAGLYNGAMINLEVNGPGKVVLFELDELKKKGFNPQVYKSGDKMLAKLHDGIKRIKEYYYARPDSLSRSYVRHWVTTGETKAWIMEQLRGTLYDKTIEIYSEEGLREMQNVIKDGTYIGADSGFHDDRVISYALSYEAWVRYAKRFVKEKASNGVEKGKVKEIKIGNLTIPIL